jgi:hypothetical protein
MSKHDTDWLFMYQALKSAQNLLAKRDMKGAAPREIYLVNQIKALVDRALSEADDPGASEAAIAQRRAAEAVYGGIQLDIEEWRDWAEAADTASVEAMVMLNELLVSPVFTATP